MKPVVLIVDDQLSNILSLESVLADLPVVIEKASSAEEGLSRMLIRPASCALVDFQMPGMGGIEFARIMKDDPALQHIPVVLVTGKIFSENVAIRAYRSGAVDFLTKPLQPAVVRRKVEFLIRYSEKLRRLSHLEEVLKDLQDAAIEPLADVLSTSRVEMVNPVLGYLSSIKKSMEQAHGEQ